MDDAYILTDFLAASGMRIRCNINMQRSSDRYPTMLGWFGNSPNVGGHQYRMYFEMSQTDNTVQFGYDNYFVNEAAWATWNIYHQIDVSWVVNKGFCIIDGETKYNGSFSFPPLSSSPDANVVIGAKLCKVSYKGNVEIYDENDVLVRNLVPFVRNNKPCMCDMLTGTIYETQGEGDVTIVTEDK